MKRTILFIVYDIVFHVERKINYFIFILLLFICPQPEMTLNSE